jgi:hypothetical protein
LPSAGGTVPAASSMSPGRCPARGGVIDSYSSADKPASVGSRRSAVGARRLSRTCRMSCVRAVHVHAGDRTKTARITG